MIIEHNEKKPTIHPTAYVAPNATICGDVTIGEGSRVMFGAQLIAENNAIVIGKNCIILENAVLRAAAANNLVLGNNILVGPNAHLVSCTIADDVFLATGCSIFHSAQILKGAEIRINGVVHLNTVFPENEVLPINWVAVGNPMQKFPPDQHEQIWEVQQKENFPAVVYDITNRDELSIVNQKLCSTMSERLGTHKNDRML